MFHNPYNFVRTPDRTEVLKDLFAGDHDPSDPKYQENHSRYWAERYTGVIPVRLRTQTPLFITNPETRRKMERDREKEERKAHYIYDCLEYIPATALKGMLSSAYEIVTNSRYRVFGKRQHKKRLGYRSPARANLVPGRVSCSDGNWSVTLFTGTSTINQDGSADGPLYAAWLPCFDQDNRQKICSGLQHGVQYTDVTLQKYRHTERHFEFWSVSRIQGHALSPITAHTEPLGASITVSGYVVKSGKIFVKKHDERFFFNCYPGAASPCPNPLPISDKVRKNYEDLIADYQRVHEGDANPPIGGGSVHGAHIEDKKRLELSDGCFVYVKMNSGTVSALYPVQISRELNEKAPWDFLDDSLKPAESIDKLSPADRLFGWVAQERTREPGAWKGKVRIGDGVYVPRSQEDPPSPVQRFNNPLPLSILGAPKPAQARFYLGDGSGKPQKDGQSKEKAGYKNGKKLRGRKVYLHHTLAHLDGEGKAAYWDERQGAKMAVLPEYRQPSGERQCTGQNRSITGWIPKGTDFRFDIKVENLTREELGALLALLSLEQQYFRLGFAKPLGLGSVALSIQWNGEEPLPFITGEDFKERYHKLDASASSPKGLSKGQVQEMIRNYQKNIVRLYGAPPADDAVLGDDELFPWKESEFFKLLGSEEEPKQESERQRSFRSAWMKALEEDSAELPMEALPERETLEGLYPEEIAALPEAYKDILERVRDNCKRCWSTIPFIKDFTSAMKGFGDAPVTYPRSEGNRSDGFEGFSWFVENERIQDERCVGHSLPAVGGALSGF